MSTNDFSDPKNPKSEKIDIDKEKKVLFELPRYEKRSLGTLLIALILPSTIYGFQLIGPRSWEQWMIVLSLFAHPLAVILNTISDVGYSWSLMFSLCVNFLLVFLLHKSKKMTTRRIFALGISLGMLNLLGLKILDWWP